MPQRFARAGASVNVDTSGPTGYRVRMRLRKSIPILALLATAALACGAPRPAPTWEAVPAPVDAPAEPTSTPLAPGIAGPDAEGSGDGATCAVDLDRLDGHGITVTFLLPPNGEGSMSWAPRRGPESGTMNVRYEARDESGREVGVEEWVCTARGLALRRVGPDDRRMTFDPPVPALPLTSRDGAARGSVSLATPEGVSFWDYSFAFDTAPIAAYGPLAREPGTWLRVRSVLVLNAEAGGEGAEMEWASETDWIVGQDFVIPANRSQEIRFAGTIRSRTEEARTIARAGGDSGP